MHPRERPTTIAYFRLYSKMELIDRPQQLLPEIGGKFEIDLPQRGREQRVHGTRKGTARFHAQIWRLEAVLVAVGAYQLVFNGAVVLVFYVRKGRGYVLVKGNAYVSISIGNERELGGEGFLTRAERRKWEKLKTFDVKRPIVHLISADPSLICQPMSARDLEEGGTSFASSIV